MDKNNMIIHACGGAGINTAAKVFDMVSELGEGFSNVKFNYLDTSDANINKIDQRGQFWLVKTKAHSKEAISGSGGERRTHSVDIAANVSEYLDQNKILRRVPGEYHIVVASASGGSGSVISAMLVKNLLERNIPTIAVIIGDSSNGLSANNTLDTLGSLNSIAVTTNKALAVIYVNNHGLIDNGMHSAIDKANKILFNTMSTVALFLSSENEALDSQDMTNIIDQSNYKKIPIPAGLYGLAIYSKNIELPKNVIPMIGRTLSAGNIPFDTGLTLQHHKHGYVTESNALEIFKDQFPLHMVTYANFFTNEEKSLRAVTEDYNNIMNSIKIDNITGTSRSVIDDETGLVF